MSSQRPSAIRWLEAAFLLPLGTLLRVLSPRGRVAIGHAIGTLGHAIAFRHRHLARENVQRALGCDIDEAAAIARASFRHFGRLLVEVLSSTSYAQPGAERLFEVEGFEHLEQAYAQERGVLVFSAHIGNWELIALRQALAGYPMDLIARPLDNPWLEKAFNRWRESTGNRVLGKHGALRQALRTLREKRGLAILIDQNVHTPPRLFVPFFGRPAATTPTLASLAIHRRAPIIPVVSIPRPDGGYRIVYGAPIALPADGDDETRIRELTVRATQQIERWIRAQPETWLWLHNRWKSQPPPDEEDSKR